MCFRTRLVAVAFSAFALVITGSAQAPARDSAQMQNDDLSSLRQQADAGNAQAQFALGNRYYRGLGIPQNHDQAVMWYRKSAEQGFAPAQNQLGTMYQHKWGVERITDAPQPTTDPRQTRAMRSPSTISRPC